MWGVVEVSLNTPRQRKVAGHHVLVIFLKSSLAIAIKREADNNADEKRPMGMKCYNV